MKTYTNQITSLPERLKSRYFTPFARNVTVVATGTAIAQVISLVTAPFVTRLYGPEAYGLQGLFLSVVGLLTIAAALGYPTAIVLPKKDPDAYGLALLSVLIAFVFSILVAIVLLFFGQEFLALFNAQAISQFLHLIPFAVFFSVLAAVLTQWFIRNKAFKYSSKIAVLRASLLSTSKIGFGLVHPTALALIAINVFGGVVSTVLAFIGWRRRAGHKSRKIDQKAVFEKLPMLAKRHSDFPTLRTPQNLLNGFSRSLPVLLLAMYFDASAAGFYTLAIVVLGMPAGLIGGSVMSVFYPRVTEAIHEGENVQQLIVRTTLGLAAIGVVPILLIVLVGPLLFQFVFGAEWRTAGVYAQWLAPWIFFQFINKPAVSAVAPLRLQGGLLIYEVFSTGSKVIALWVGFHYFKNDVAAVALYSCFGVVAYVWLIAWVIRRSGDDHQIEKLTVESE